MSGAPQAGDKFNVLKDEREAREIANKRLQLQREQGIMEVSEEVFDEVYETNLKSAMFLAQAVARHQIAAGNIGCMMQIGGATEIPVVHTVELLDWATGGPMPAALADAAEVATGARPVFAQVELGGHVAGHGHHDLGRKAPQQLCGLAGNLVAIGHGR